MTAHTEKGLNQRARKRRSGDGQRPRRRWGHARRNHLLGSASNNGFDGWRTRFLF